MKALAKLERAPGLTLTRVKKPEVGHNDVMIRIRKTAICGTDLHIWNWDDWAQKTIPVPMHVGHEYVGEIVEIGQEVRGFKVGDRVSGEGHITCGFCRNCRAGRRHLCRNTVGVGVNREGAFAEYLVIPAFNAFRIPDDISDDLASIFDPFGNATHTALTFNLVGEDVLITGAGPIGIMATAIAKPTKMCARSRALPSRNLVRRVTTRSRKSTKMASRSLRVMIRGRPLSSATMLTPKLVCSGVNL